MVLKVEVMYITYRVYTCETNQRCEKRRPAVARNGTA